MQSSPFKQKGNLKMNININNYQLAVIKQGIKALLIGMKINSAYTSTNCRNFVTKLTGVKYPSGKKGLTLALNDINQIIEGGE